MARFAALQRLRRPRRRERDEHDVLDERDERSRRGGRRGQGPAKLLRALAKLVSGVGLVIFLVIGVGVLLVALDANEDNEIVDAVLGVGRYLVEPFRDIIDLEKGKEHLQIAINWGIGAAVYLGIALLIAAALRALAGRGRGDGDAVAH